MNNKEKELIEPKFPIIVTSIVIALCLLNLVVGYFFLGMNTSDKGQWGDIFGAANALFSGLAFVLIYHGIKVQRYEVEIAKRELEESKQQTKDQKAALDKQNEATERQMFENTFFKLLEFSRNTLDSVIYSTTAPNSKKYFGIEALKFYSDKIYHRPYSDQRDGFGAPNNTKELPKNNKLWQSHLWRLETTLNVRCGQHLRHLLQIIRLVLNYKTISNQYYLSILFNSLNNIEVMFLAYYICLQDEIHIKTEIEKYGLLKILNIKNDLRSLALLYAFEPSAFGLPTLPEEFLECSEN